MARTTETQIGQGVSREAENGSCDHDHGSGRHRNGNGRDPSHVHAPGSRCDSHDHECGQGHSHSHGLGHSHFSHADTARKLAIALGLTFLILGAEVFGGLKSHSLALLSDAVHMLTDVFALGLAWYAQIQAARPPTVRRSYGYHRAGIMAALANSLLLVIMSAGIGWEAVERIRQPHAIEAPVMVGVAGVALAVNLVIAWMLSRGQGSDLNVRSALLHVIGDAAAAAGVVVGGAVILWRPDWTLIDPVLSLVIAVIIVGGAWQIVVETYNVLMEGAPSNLDPEDVKRSMAAIEGVEDVHHVHLWVLSPGINSLSGHVVIQDQALSHAETIREQILAMLRTRYQVDHATIQFEHQQCGLACCLVADTHSPLRNAAS